MSRHLLLNGSFAPSVANFRGALLRDLAARGYKVHVSVPSPSEADARAIEALGAVLHQAPLERAGSNIAADLRYLHWLRRLIRQLQPELVLNYTIKPNIWGSLAARAENVASASMVTGLGFALYPQQSLRWRAIGAATRWLYRRATAANRVVLFQNPDDRDDFIAAGCLADPKKARLVNGSGVDLSHFAPVPLPAQAVFLMVARLLVSKGVREYAAAAMQILAKRSDCRILLAGNLDDTPDCIDADELAHWQASGIEYLGWLDDVRPALAQASVFVLPSYREGTPRTVLEASALGRPTITTDAPGCRETVLDGETGLLVPPRQVEELASAMEQIADDPATRARMGGAARSYCESRFSVSEVNKALIGHLGL